MCEKGYAWISAYDIFKDLLELGVIAMITSLSASIKK